MKTTWNIRAADTAGAVALSLGPAFAAPQLSSDLVAQEAAAKEIKQKYSQNFGI